MVPNSFSFSFQPWGCDARYPRLGAIWKGYRNPRQMGYAPMYLCLEIGNPLMTQYGICCCLPFSVSDFSTK